MSMLTRQAELRDVRKICALVNSVYRGENSTKGWTTEARLIDGQRIDIEILTKIIGDSNERIFVLEENSEIVGCVQSTTNATAVFLGMLSVPVELQGRGLGALLIRAVEVDAKARGFKQVKMNVLSVRHELIEWYFRKGYKNTGESFPWSFDEKWGLPKVEGLSFLVLSKDI